jgi:ATP-dependent DNA helicase 2 subunit 1
MRTLPKNDIPRLFDDKVDLFKNVIRGLKFKYRPDKFENPALQTLWRNIEATALNKNKPEEFDDLTIPNVENQNRKVEKQIDEIKQLIFPPDYVMGVTKKSATKRKVRPMKRHSTALYQTLYEQKVLITVLWECTMYRPN